jgi:hypothetical protein
MEFNAIEENRRWWRCCVMGWPIVLFAPIVKVGIRVLPIAAPASTASYEPILHKKTMPRTDSQCQ